MTTTPQTQPSATFQQSDPRDLFDRAAAITAGVIAAVKPEQLTSATPCDEFDVRALLAHLVGVGDRAAAIGRGEDAMSVSGVRPVADDAWVGAWADVTADFDKAWVDDAVLAVPVTLPWATGPAGEILKGYINEVVIHTWDLAQATGQNPTWDDDVVAAAYEAITASLPAGGRSEMFAAIMAKMDTAALPPGFGGAPFGEAVAPPEGARPIDRLVAYTGRTPA